MVTRCTTGLLVSLLALAAIAASGTDLAMAAHARAPRMKLAQAHSLGTHTCAARLRARPAHLTARRRHRIAKRARNCRERIATVSSVPHQPLYWGASIGTQLTGGQAPWDMSAVTKFEGLADKSLSLLNFFVPFANCGEPNCSFYKFPTTPLENIRQHGAIPMLSWSSQSIPSSTNEPDFQLSDVISGRYDAYIREFAEAARAWQHPFFLRFDWEMNGNWFPWSEGVNGNQPGEFVAAWRHVHDIFSSVGATNVTWVWCPNVDPSGDLQKVESLYPGNEYVDWTGLDGYNWGPRKGGWKTFNQLYQSTYHQITDSLAPSKPMLIGEMGSTEQGGSKANWINEAMTSISTEYPAIRGLLWYDCVDEGMDWPIESSPGSAESFARAIKSPEFQGNSYANLAPTTIAPPS